jgi:hypothetical protein
MCVVVVVKFLMCFPYSVAYVYECVCVCVCVCEYNRVRVRVSATGITSDGGTRASASSVHVVCDEQSKRAIETPPRTKKMESTRPTNNSRYLVLSFPVRILVTGYETGVQTRGERSGERTVRGCKRGTESTQTGVCMCIATYIVQVG